jgi:colanic acid biosynthesis protein WcaH
MSTDHIPDALFKTILKSVPIPTVDVVIIRNGREFLLTKRRNKPFKGKWFLPGGRIRRGEQILQAVEREVTALGIRSAEEVNFVGLCELINPPGELGVRQHAIQLVFAVKVAEYVEPEVDEESTEVRWFHSINKKWPRSTIEMLTKAGFN